MSESEVREATKTEEQSQPTENRAQPFIVNRAFTCIVTSSQAMPGSAGVQCFFVVRDKEGKLALADVEHNMLNIPPAAVLTTSLEAAVSLLLEVKKTLFSAMSDFSGVQVSVVHTEAMFDPSQGRIVTELSLYPVQYVPLSAFVAQSPSSPVRKVTPQESAFPEEANEAPAEGEVVAASPEEETASDSTEDEATGQADE